MESQLVESESESESVIVESFTTLIQMSKCLPFKQPEEIKLHCYLLDGYQREPKNMQHYDPVVQMSIAVPSSFN